MPFNNELDDRQLKAIELLATGETVSKTADIVGVNRKTITEWKKQEKFKRELDKQVTGLKSKVDEKILRNIEPLIDRLVKIALKSKSDKTALDAIVYALNRVCGTPTNKTQDVTDNNNKEKPPVDIDKVLESIKKQAEDK